MRDRGRLVLKKKKYAKKVGGYQKRVVKREKELFEGGGNSK